MCWGHEWANIIWILNWKPRGYWLQSTGWEQPWVKELRSQNWKAWNQWPQSPSGSIKNLRVLILREKPGGLNRNMGVLFHHHMPLQRGLHQLWSMIISSDLTPVPFQPDMQEHTFLLVWSHCAHKRMLPGAPDRCACHKIKHGKARQWRQCWEHSWNGPLENTTGQMWQILWEGCHFLLSRKTCGNPITNVFTQKCI